MKKCQSYPPLAIYSKESKAGTQTDILCTDVHSSIIHNFFKRWK